MSAIESLTATIEESIHRYFTLPVDRTTIRNAGRTAKCYVEIHPWNMNRATIFVGSENGIYHAEDGDDIVVSIEFEHRQNELIEPVGGGEWSYELSQWEPHWIFSDSGNSRSTIHFTGPTHATESSETAAEVCEWLAEWLTACDVTHLIREEVS